MSRRSESPDTKKGASLFSEVQAGAVAEWDHHEERRLVRKIDVRCMVSLDIVHHPAAEFDDNLQPALVIVRF